MKQSIRAQRRCGAVCGIMLLAGGLVLLGMKLGWIPEELIQSIPFIPLAMVLTGAFMLVSAIMRKRGGNGPANEFGDCCPGGHQSKGAMK